VRANKFVLDTVLYKVGEDAISDAFSRAADASDSTQVVLIFPTLQEELSSSQEDQRAEKQRAAVQHEESSKKLKEDEERDKLKSEWLGLLFSDQSVAAMSPEGPLPITWEAGNKRSPTSLVVWVGDNPRAENAALRDLPASLGSAALMSLSWPDHAAAEGMQEFSLSSPEVTDGSWYLREKVNFENEDLDMLHDVELLGRSMVEAIEPKLGEHGLDWKNVIILGFGKGAGIALYAALLKSIPKPVAAMVLFSPVVAFPSFLGEKLQQVKRGAGGAPTKLFLIWGAKNRSTPGTYKQLLNQTVKKAPDVHCTPDNLPEGEHAFDAKNMSVLASLLPLCLPR